MKTIYGILLSASCLAGGFGFGYIFSKNKFEKKADDEITLMRNNFNERLKEIIKSEPRKKSKEEKKYVDIKKEAEERSNSKYINYSAPYRTNEPKVTKTEDTGEQIEIITPEEFMNSNYNTVTLLYYKDGTFTDDDGNVIHNIKNLLGPNINVEKSFGRYEDDSVYVRNYKKEIDYEILLQNENYANSNE